MNFGLSSNDCGVVKFVGFNVRELNSKYFLLFFQ